ncbi:MAG: hypothetical protein WBP11_09185 [Dokdonella sp.]
MFGGLSVWVLLVCAAAAWSRAYNFTDVRSRYTDLLIPSFVAQIYFAFRLAALVGVRFGNVALARAAALSMMLFSCVGLAHASMTEFEKWRVYDFMTRIGASHVRAYVDGDRTALDGHPFGYTPHPHQSTLPSILDDSTGRAFLPLSITPSVPILEQLGRSCRWIPQRGALPPVTGYVTCARGDQDLPADGQYYMGRLSAFTYLLWSTIGRQSYPAFQRDDEKRYQPVERANCSVDLLNGTTQPSRAAQATVRRCHDLYRVGRAK